MSPSKSLVGILLFTGFLLGFAESHQNQNITAYEVLENYNFPKGVLPNGVKSYILNEDGSFVVHLDESCKFEIDAGYTLDYKSKITGILKYGSLKSLKGVSVKVFLVWLSITEVSRGDGQLDFFVGPVSASFPLSNFFISPRCGCGLDCDHDNDGGSTLAISDS